MLEVQSRDLDELGAEENSWRPPSITSIEDTGLHLGFLADLAIKVLYFRGQATGYEIADHMHVPYQAVLAPVMEFLKREQLCEVRGAGGVGAGAYQYIITDKGVTRAREQLERSTYSGAVPVPWKDYVASIHKQRARRLTVDELMIRDALNELVLDGDLYHKIGAAVNSGKSLFLYGAPGNGKSTIAENIGRAVLGYSMYIPYAVEVDGHIIKLYDEMNHEALPPEVRYTTGTLTSRPDSRWVRIKRPAIMVGGELNMEGLELIYDYNNKYYEAPFQMKANGGMFLIDDFGRQQVRPHDLLNRWIVPMEKRVDFLALHTGRKIEMPFEVLIVFSTNLPPKDLVDEAFLRRIRHKIEIPSPSFENYIRIFERVSEARGLKFDENAVKYLLKTHYVDAKRPLRANHPRDLVDQLIDIATYWGAKPKLTKKLIDQAAESYFVDLS